MLQTLLLLLNAVVAFALVIVILLQRQDSSGGGLMGGANLGASPVARNPLARPTAVLATIFMGTCLVLAVMSAGKGKHESVFDGVEAPPINAPMSIEDQANDLLKSLQGEPAVMGAAVEAEVPVPAPENTQ